MSLLDNIYAVLKNVVALAHDLHRYQTEIKEIRHELRDLTFVVQRLAQDIHHSKEISERERTNLLLEVENKLLRLEQRVSGTGIQPHNDQSEIKRDLPEKVASLKNDDRSPIVIRDPGIRLPKTKRAKG
jgi:hypothetical protein